MAEKKEEKGEELDMAIYREDRVGQLLRKHFPDGDITKLDLTTNEHLDIFGMSYLRVNTFEIISGWLASPLKTAAETKIVDIGSGYGGTGMHLATKYGFQYTGVELQEYVSSQATKYVEQFKLTSKMTCETGSILDQDFVARTTEKHGHFDSAISILTILHLQAADRLPAFKNIASLLGTSGRYYIECYCVEDGASLAPEHAKMLEDVVCCPHVPTISQYTADLKTAGFNKVFVEPIQDTTEEWRSFTTGRSSDFNNNLEANKTTFSEANLTHLTKFYSTIATLFQESALRGVRILATK
mmetsp:Transcript_16289/g.19533  ORF Transcript_16289/g.19533 Transcript_16289/m.19533 type:complete len:299 (+) Transcript_16289:124-1020(+)|eukprot:CAMPEP_0197847532 /NCGR_PEP_ID=MMETSP1438-20131217/6367_1 /TAXON_ID=1461541 /ORGANISM="Pterosperma sp., Strain CCMP1384" /LENGTH=298 /DNA_ID=CAMNT_0043459479 /DNA_START=112 /DNA_END=1008 /DNA_ORIENTATION=+